MWNNSILLYDLQQNNSFSQIALSRFFLWKKLKNFGTTFLPKCLDYCALGALISGVFIYLSMWEMIRNDKITFADDGIILQMTTDFILPWSTEQKFYSFCEKIRKVNQMLNKINVSIALNLEANFRKFNFNSNHEG